MLCFFIWACHFGKTVLKYCISPWDLPQIIATYLCLISKNNYVYFLYQYPNASLQVLLIEFCALAIQVAYYTLLTEGQSLLKNRQVLSSFLPNICTILTRFPILDSTWWLNKGIKAAVLLMSLFLQLFCSWTNIYFLHKTNLLNFWSLILPALIFKKIPNWYCPVFGFNKTNYLPFLTSTILLIVEFLEYQV